MVCRVPHVPSSSHTVVSSRWHWHPKMPCNSSLYYMRVLQKSPCHRCAIYSEVAVSPSTSRTFHLFPPLGRPARKAKSGGRPTASASCVWSGAVVRSCSVSPAVDRARWRRGRPETSQTPVITSVLANSYNICIMDVPNQSKSSNFQVEKEAKG